MGTSICRPEMRRNYRTRDEAYGYLRSRGFIFLPSGWRNGRWVASVELQNAAFAVMIWLTPAIVA